MQNKLFISFFICLLSVTQFSCAPKNNSKRIIVASYGKVESLDPARVTTLKAFQLLASLGDTLYVINNDGKLVPKLALGMPIISDEKLKITINLKENIYFHDGTQFDAKAMKFTIDRFRRIGLNLGKKICWVREWPFASNSKKTFALNISQITLQVLCSNNFTKEVIS